MRTELRPDETRRKLGWIFAITLGVLLGLFIKRLHVGLMLGLVIGLLSSNLINKKK